MKSFFLINILVIGFYSCSKPGLNNNEVILSSMNNYDNTMQNTDLTSYGIEINMLLPKNASIEKDDLGIVYIKKNNFNIMITPLGSSEDTNLMQELKQAKDDDSANFDMFEIIKEDKQGYLYKYEGLNGEEYGFNYNYEKNGELYSFINAGDASTKNSQQNNLIMYNACKNAN